MKKSGKYIPCFYCEKPVYVFPSRMNHSRHFCSMECRFKAQGEYQKSINQHLKKRITRICKRCGKSFEVHAYRSKTAKFCSLSCFREIPNASHYSGDNILYSGVHKWVYRHKGKATEKKCAFCSKPAKEWANIDHKYRRCLSDYIPLCIKCHRRYDRR